MACPKKFSDLHKNLDDAFKKDFCSGAVNVEIKQGYDAGSFANGSMTMKVNHNPLTGGVNSNLECKSTLGADWGPCAGAVATESINDAGLYKVKVEKSAACGSKVTYDTDIDIAGHCLKKANLDFAYACEKLNMGLKVAQADGACAAPTNVNAHAVFAAAGCHNLGLNLDYNVKSGAVSHHVKYNTGCNQGNISVGLQDAQNTSLCYSHALNKPVNMLGFGTLNLSNAHIKADYGINSGKYGAAICLEGNYQIGAFKTTGYKMYYNPINGDFKEMHKFKVTDALTATFGYSSNAHKGILSDASMGASLSFSV